MSHALKEKPNAEEVPMSGAAGTIVNGHYLPPPEDKDGKIWVRTSALVQANARDLYTMWRNVESAPVWQEQISRGDRYRCANIALGHGVRRKDNRSDLHLYDGFIPTMESGDLLGHER